jgi:exosortase A
LLLLVLLSGGCFFGTWSSIIEIWARSKTYTHGFVIVPISLWLIWSRRDYYLRLVPTVAYSPLLAVLAGGFLWLCGDLSHIVIIKQVAAVAMLVAGIWVVLGHTVTLSLSFPLLFLFFMVPMGEELIPALIEFTTTFTVKLIRLTGLPVYRDGHYFTLTSGSWSVIEACSGISYLIASVTLGFVFAYLNYSHYWKRVLFMLLSVVVPIVANGFRAYMIVMIGHLSDMTLAVGVDHLVYGGVFFGVVMLLLFYLGSFWRDPPFTPIAIVPRKASVSSTPQQLAVSALLLAGFGIWQPLAATLLDKQGQLALPAYVATQVLGDWRQTADPKWLWEPKFPRAAEHSKAFYSDSHGNSVGLYYASFGKEEQGAELVNSENALVSAVESRRLRISATDTLAFALGQQTVTLNVTVLKENSGQVLVVMDSYQLNGEISNNRYWVKARQLVKHLSGDTSPELKLVLWVQPDNDDIASAKRLLTGFLTAWLKQQSI